MRVSRIVKAEKMSGSKGLVRLKLDVGGEIMWSVAALGEAYSPKDLEGELVAVVTNLEPQRIFGLDSDVVVLAAIGGPSVPPLQRDRAVPHGCKVA